MADDMRQRWLHLTRVLRMPASGDVCEELLERYREAHRRFHVTAHLRLLLDTLDELDADPRLKMAGWFHDAIYEPGRPDNERQSARLARRRLAAAGLAQADVDFVSDAVLATAGHTACEQRFDPLLDADLAVLGAQPPAYQEYREGIEQEYAKVPRRLFLAGRRRFLREMLDRPSIFRTHACQLRYEAQARSNLQEELDRLTDGATP